MNLQDDEVEFTDEIFKQIYFEIILQLNQERPISVDVLVNHPKPEIAKLVTSILMDDEKHVLSDWAKQDIIVNGKDSNLAKMVQDAIYNLRRILVKQKIDSLTFIDYKSEDARIENMEAIMNYTKLRVLLCDRLNRIV